MWQPEPAPGPQPSWVADLAKTGTGTEERASARVHTGCSGSSLPAEALMDAEPGVLICSSSGHRLPNMESECVYWGIMCHRL